MSVKMTEIGAINEMHAIRDPEPHSANNIAKDLMDDVLRTKHANANVDQLMQAMAILAINITINCGGSRADQQWLVDRLITWIKGAADIGIEAAAVYHAQAGGRA